VEPRDIIEGPAADGARRPVRMTGVPRIEFRSSTLAWLIQSGSGWMLIAATLIGFGIGAFAGYPLETLAGLVVLVGGYVLWRYVENRAALFWLDGERLFMRRGILVRSEEEIELYRIKDVKVTFSIIQQMFDNGTITISSTDSSGDLTGIAATGTPRTMISVPHVIDARLIRGEIRDRVEAIRQRRGVRELDIG